METEISTAELLEIIDNKDVKIIDVRSSDAFNGWTLKNEARGGHIKNATSLPEKWLNYI